MKLLLTFYGIVMLDVKTNLISFKVKTYFNILIVKTAIFSLIYASSCDSTCQTQFMRRNSNTFVLVESYTFYSIFAIIVYNNGSQNSVSQ